MSIYNTIANVDWKNPGDILSTATSLTKATKSVIGKVKSLTKEQKKPSTIRDIYTNGFISNNSEFRPNFFSRMFDEPTYLSFRISFEPKKDAILNRNIAYNDVGQYNGITTSFYENSYDYLPEPFLQDFKNIKETKNYELTIDGVDTGFDLSDGTRIEDMSESYTQNLSIDMTYGDVYSTEKYLWSQLGEYQRQRMLSTFKMALRDIEDNFPYYFKSIEGLQSLSDVKFSSGSRLKDAKITITCDEALDMKITQLLQLYKKIVWDDVYQRWVLPDMMRYFSMKIYVSEIRLFHDIKFDDKSSLTYDFSDTNVRNMSQYPPQQKERTIDKISKIVRNAETLSNAYLGTKSTLAKVMNGITGTYNTVMDIWSSITTGAENLVNSAINDIMPTICYECHMCEFNIESMMQHINSLSSANERKITSPKIVINVGQVRERQIYPLNNYLLRSTTNSNKYSITESLKTKSEFLGSLISDDLMLKRFMNDKNLLSVVINNAINDYGGIDEDTINRRRFNNILLNKLFELNYPKDDMTTDMALSSLTTFAMNEASQWINMINPSGSATNQDKETIQFLNNVGDEIKRHINMPDSSVIQLVNPYSGLTETVDSGEIMNPLGDSYVSNTDEPKQINDIEIKTTESGLTDIDNKNSYNDTNKNQTSSINNGDLTSFKSVKESLNDLYKILLSRQSTANEYDTKTKENLKALKKMQDDLLDGIYGDGVESAANSENYIKNIKIKSNIYNTILDRLSLATSDPVLMNLINKARLSDYGTYESVANNPNVVAADRMKELGEMLQQIADDVYNNEDIKSMAVSEKQKATIANSMYDKMLSEMSVATTDPLLKEIIKRYQMEVQQYVSTANNGKITPFSILND